MSEFNDNNVTEDEFHVSSKESLSDDIHETVENTNIEITSLSNSNVNCENNNNDMGSYTFSETAPKSPTYGVPNNDLNKCLMCNKKVYPMEMLNADGKVYHKQCFKCAKCKTLLSITNFNISNNTLYCKIHFMERFMMRGRFDDDKDVNVEVRSGDSAEPDDIPTTDTKGLLAKFRELESSVKTDRLAPMPVSPNATSKKNLRHVQPTDEVVRSEDLPPDELPAPDTTKSMVAMFKAMENQKKIAPTPETALQIQRQAKILNATNQNIRLVNQRNQNTPVVSCHNDEHNDVNTAADELPEFGTTKNLLSKFQSETNEEPQL